MLPILVRGADRLIERDFLVDSGADLSMAPYALCRTLGVRWADGTPMPILGISQRRTCVVMGRIHDVDLIIPDAGLILRIPIVFAKGNAPYVLGRGGFFELFTITFDAAARQTAFQLAEV